MNIAEQTVNRPHIALQNHWITCSYVALALIAVAVIYLASAGSGFAEADLARAIALP